MAETNAYPELARDLRFFPVQNDAPTAPVSYTHLTLPTTG